MFQCKVWEIQQDGSSFRLQVKTSAFVTIPLLPSTTCNERLVFVAVHNKKVSENMDTALPMIFSDPFTPHPITPIHVWYNKTLIFTVIMTLMLTIDVVTLHAGRYASAL